MGSIKTCRTGIFVLIMLVTAALAGADSFDWRNVDGMNYMTPAKPQGPYECRSFAGIAAFEAKIKIAFDSPDMDVDLSERHATISASGTNGFSLFSGSGVLTEEEMPYDMNPLVFQAGWTSRTYRISDHQMMTITDEENQRQTIQQWIREYGPLYTENYHGNTVVGYDDDAQHWIFKETGGPDYGDNGYFYYPYGYMQDRWIAALSGDVYYANFRVAGRTFWQGGTGDWSVGSNWSPEFPDHQASAFIDGGTAQLFGGTGQVDSLCVGWEKTGGLSLGAGASLSSEYGYIAHSPGSDGAVILDGSGTIWNNTSDLFIGMNGPGSLEWFSKVLSF